MRSISIQIRSRVSTIKGTIISSAKIPIRLNSYAGFGEAYYNIASDLKLTGGLRWTEDRKHFTDIPSEVIDQGYGYPITGVVNQQWDELTGRAVANWTPKLDFTDQTLIYGSYSRGYKAGGANPPGAMFQQFRPRRHRRARFIRLRSSRNSSMPSSWVPRTRCSTAR